MLDAVSRWSVRLVVALCAVETAHENVVGWTQVRVDAGAAGAPSALESSRRGDGDI